MPSDDAALEELLGLLVVITDILRSFAARPTDDLDGAIIDALARIGTFTGVDRSYLFVVSPDGVLMDNTHEWCADGIAPQIQDLQAVPIELIRSWLPGFAAGEHAYIPDVAILPDDRRDERELLESQGILSLITVPLITTDRLVGFIGFDSVRQRRAWSDGAMLLLRAVADVICGGLARRNAFDALADSEYRFRTLVQHSSDVVMVLSEPTILRELGPSAAPVLGWRDEDRLGTSYLDTVHPEDADRVVEALERAATRPGSAVVVPDHRLRHADGSWRWMLATAVDLHSDAMIDGLVLNAHDITSRKTAEEALQHQALHDPLTCLPNRALLLDRLQHALDGMERSASIPSPGRMGASPESVGVVFLDLDRFKLVNDSLGHTTGDRLLVEVARRLLGNVRAGDTVARFGGDEFVVLLNRVASAEDAKAATDRLLEAFSAPFEIGGRRHLVTASAGLVLSDEIHDAEALLRDADAAMYQAKERGRDRVQRFDAPLREQLLRRVELEHDLHGSVLRGELELAYQPLFELAGDRMIGAEALLRWNHPTRGRIPPVDFIPLAEESGLIVPIGTWVLGEALRQLGSWRAAHHGLDELMVSVNLSVHQLTDDDLPATVAGLLAVHDVAPESLCLELTESALMAEPEAGLAVLSELRALGVGLAIDDFGTGYSSLAYLRDLPVTTLKIDRSFVTGLSRDNSDSRMVAAIIGLAQEFGLTTVAEGVETCEQLTELRRLGCDVVQGYYLREPCVPSELAALAGSPGRTRERLTGSVLGAVG
jgi:diguanylate cyclase (GGDEF)-like protein/PAS domain S-box-containing protein